MKVPQDIIDEAAKNGIVEGAVIQCVTTHGRPLFGTVQNVCDWNWTGTNLLVGKDQEGISLFAKNSERWATVIEPAPSQGLEEGMATECSPAMRAAIVELAKELGVNVWRETARDNNDPVLIFHDGEIIGCFRNDRDIKASYTPEDFIAKMRATAKKPKPITVISQGSTHTVEFRKGYVKIGRDTVDNETVRAIAANLKD